MGFYRPPRIRTIRDDTQTSVVLSGGEVIPAFIGTALGKTSVVNAFQATMAATDVYNFADLRPSGPINAILALRSDLQGGIKYSAPVDYAFDQSLQRITFQDVALASPYITGIADLVAASSLLDIATTYFYVITAIRDLDLTGPVVGETAASNEISSKPRTSTSHLVLSWRPVAGAKGYKIYRSVVSGNYTGSSLLATVASGFVTSYEDSGAATSSGSPPGVLVFAQVTAGSNTPNSITPGQTLTFDVDAVPHVATLAGTRPSITASGGAYPVTITTSVNDTLNLKVTDSLGSYSTTVVFSAGSTTALQIAAQINAKPFTEGSANGGSGQQVLTADAAGSGITIQVVGGNAMATLGLTPGTATGTGSLVDYLHVTTAQLAAALELQIPGAGFSVAANGRLVITNDLGGSAHSLQPHADTNTLLGFSTSLVAGNNAVAGTALRRPAFHGGLFFVDYNFIGFDHFNAKLFTNLPRGIAEYGLGSNLAIALSLAMGTSGSGNGASQAITMSVPDDTLPAYQTALDFLRRRRDVTLVAPCTVVDGIGPSTLEHCIEMSNEENQRERRCVIGTPKGTLTGDEDTSGTAVFLARQLANERAILAHPWPFVNVQQSDGTIVNTEMDGWASAACVAGRIASLSDRATSPTVQRLFGITALGVTLDEPEMNTLGSAGVLVLTVEDGNVIIRDGITTSIDSQTESRIQIGLVDDQLRQTLRTEFKSFRGRKLLPTLLKLVVRRTLRILALFQKLELIAGYNASSVSAVQDVDVLTTIDASFSYRPLFDVKDIDFKYSLDLTTGTIA